MTPIGTFPHPDQRIKACPECNGDGCFDEAYFRNDHSVGNRHSECSYCDGTGEVEIEVEPITLEDLESSHE